MRFTKFALCLALGGAVAAPLPVLAEPVGGAARTIDGSASWYGGKFHGRTTANGETYNMNAMTAAHRSLAFGTRVRVTNTRNGRAVEVRINDRGPFIGGRVIDLSRSAAQEIGMINSGTAPVRIEVLGRGASSESNTRTASLY